MAFAGGKAGGVKNDINVTPLVDVVLVLLIIFMVVTPMLQRGKPVELPKSDTGAWSYYQLGGAESNLNYHEVLVQFLSRLCEDTDSEALFCNLETTLAGYLKAKPVVTRISKKTKHGRLYVTFTLDKVSTVTVKGPGGAAVATVSRGKHVFSVKKGRGTAVTITAKDLAGNSAVFTG